MDSIRPFQSHGTAFQSTGGSTADAIPSTPMGTSAIRIVNGTGAAAKVALGDTAAEAVASLTTQYITVLGSSVEYLQIKNTQRFIASDTADLDMIMGTGGGGGYGAGGGSGASGFVTEAELDTALEDYTTTALSPDARTVIITGMTDGGVTNNDAAIAAALVRVAALTPTATKRVALVVPAGYFAFQTPFVVPPYTDYIQLNGSKWNYTGTDYTQAVITAGGANTVTAERNGKYYGVNITTGISHLWRPVAAGGTVDLDHFAGFRLANTDFFIFQMEQIDGFAIGLQLHPYNGSTSSNLSSVTYGHLKLGNFANVKICVDLRGHLNNGFVNQNTFYEGNFFSSSAMEHGGSTYGIRYSTESGGYSGQNNNNFIAPAFQQAFSNPATSAWVSGATAVVGRRIHHLNNSYVVSVGGVMSATGPTHTTGSAANGAATLIFEDLLRRSPELYESAGAYNKIIGARREGGYGPSRIVRTPAANTAINSTAEYLHFATITAATVPAQGVVSEIEFQGVTVASCKAVTGDVKVSAFEAGGTVATLIKDIHRRAIKGTSLWRIPGMGFTVGTATLGAAIITDSSTAAIRLMVDSISMDSSTSTPMLLIPFSPEFGKISICALPGQDRSDPVRFRAYAADSSRNLLTNRTGDPQQFYLSDGSGSASLHWVAGNADDYKVRQIMPATAACAYVAVQWDAGCISGVRIVHHQTSFDSATYYQSAPPSIWPHTSNSVRSSTGSPTVGFFEQAGEFIANTAYTGTGTSPGWYVSTAGVLCPDWVTATAVRLGEFRKNASKVYYAAAAGTTGATAPTHGSGSASDDTVTWVYYGVQAALTAAPNS